MKRFIKKNAEILTGIIALVFLYFVLLPSIRLFYPAGMIPPEMVMKPWYIIYSAFTLLAGVWLYLRIVKGDLFNYFDYRNIGSEVDFFTDFKNITPWQRVISSIIFIASLFFFFSLVLLSGVMA